jgi:hypothetical protein
MIKKNMMIVENDRSFSKDLTLTLQEMVFGGGRITTGEASVERVAIGHVGMGLMEIKLDGIEADEKRHAIVDLLRVIDRARCVHHLVRTDNPGAGNTCMNRLI